MTTIIIRSGLLFVVVVASILLIGVEPTAAERASDARELISLETPEGWTAVLREQMQETIRSLRNPNLNLVGVDRERVELLFINADEADDLIPSLQVFIFDFGGLGLEDGDLEELQANVESSYTESIGSRFKLLTLTRSRVGGSGSARLTGIYRWRTVNMKVLQHLVPGTNHLYAITYTAKERDFSRHLPAVEEALATVTIADPPLVLGWLWDGLRWGVLIVLVLGILWLILFLSGSGFGRRPIFNPFVR